MRSHDAMKTDEANEAAWEAARGGIIGAAKWGAAAALLGGIGYLVSPVYRNLTVQFKIYMQMSGMVVGSMIEADHRLRQYEARVRLQRRVMMERAKWERFEREYLDEEKEKDK